MTANEQTVWIVIQRHRGEANAIGQHALARATGLTARQARQIVTHLIIKHNRMIASCCTPGGYFIPENQEEINQAYDRLHGQAVLILKRAKVLKNVDLTGIQQELFTPEIEDDIKQRGIN